VDVAKRFAQNLARYREQADLTQEELAARAEVHRTQVGLLENGKRVPKIDTLVRLAGALSISPCDLLNGIIWEPGTAKAGSYRVSK
jgi:transcriptional regulator with XRE-family HTH domain